MTKPVRWSCVCCALPQRLVRHVEAKAGRTANVRAHEQTSAALRAQRHRAAVQTPPASGSGAAQRAIHDAGGAQRLPGRLVRAEGAPAVADRTVNLAYDNIGRTLDFYREVLGRNSLDGHGMAVAASVHFGHAYPNAMWNGQEMLFGDGDGEHIRGFAQSLDIVAHELTHAVTQHTVRGGLGIVHRDGHPDLVGEAGALNESFSDVFASAIQQWHGGQDVHQASWLVGEGVLAPHVGHAVRSLKDPGNTRLTYDDDNQAKDMSGYVEGGDAHVNSGIPNRAFYLAAKTIGGHAWEHAAPIWYEALHHLGARATFRDAAAATAGAAAKLFGARQAHAVRAAWTEVKVLP
jgi:Zn-dependent metalloprotease